MGIKDQLMKLKENWLIAVIVVVLFLMVGGGDIIEDSLQIASYSGSYKSYDMEESIRGYPIVDSDFAQEIEERIKIKTTSLSTEVKRGTFHESAEKLKNIVTSSDSYILNENVYRSGTKVKSYYSGSYTIKVDTEKYNSVLSQLKDIGEIKSFSENERDVTGQYTDLEIELETEKARLVRYKEMYSEATKTEDKINLNDRIFNQERRIKYLENQIENIDKKVEYSTISFSLTEKRSDYANVVFVKFSELVKNIVGSINTLLNLTFVLLPWALVAGVILLIYRFVKKRK